MAIPTVYRSTDPGAPVVDYNTPGSYLNMLRKCLVDGYGSKSPAGWTEAFTGTNVAAFRNSVAAGGTGCFVRVGDTDNSEATRAVSIRAFSSMSDVDTGDNPTALRHGKRRPSNNNSASEWVCVATPTCFYVCLWQTPASTGYADIVGAGDAKSYVSADAFRYFVAAGTSGAQVTNNHWVGTTQNNVGPGASGENGLSFAKDHTGIGAGVDYGALIKWQMLALGGNGSPVSPSVTGADDSAARYILTRGNVIRGELPGVLVPLHYVGGLLPGIEHAGGLGGMGSEAVLMKLWTPSTASCGIWIETALDWDA